MLHLKSRNSASHKESTSCLKQKTSHMTLLYSNDILETNSQLLLKIAQFFEGGWACVRL